MAATRSVLGNSCDRLLMIDILLPGSPLTGRETEHRGPWWGCLFEEGIHSALQEGSPRYSMELAQTHADGMTTQGLLQVWVGSPWGCHFE